MEKLRQWWHGRCCRRWLLQALAAAVLLVPRACALLLCMVPRVCALLLCMVPRMCALLLCMVPTACWRTTRWP